MGSLDAVYRQLRLVLERHAATFDVTNDTAEKYTLESRVGPATLRSWGGKERRPSIPVAWVEVGKRYVSYHLMGIAVPAVQASLSKTLQSRMQGKTCFNFTTVDEAVIEELDAVTAASLAAFKKAGFIA